MAARGKSRSGWRNYGNRPTRRAGRTSVTPCICVGLVEISNHCARQCAYCGLRAGNDSLARYRMKADEILAAARQAVKFGYGTVVLQAGEDYGITTRLDGRHHQTNQGRNPAGGDVEPGRTGRKIWPHGAKPEPTGICCGLKPPTADCSMQSTRRWATSSLRSHRHPAAAESIGLRGRQRRHGRHSRTNLRKPGQ